MVSNEEISRRLALKRRGLNPDEEFKKEHGNICSKCGTANLKNAKFCIGCGRQLNISINKPEINQHNSNFKICPNCNSKNKPNSKFCISCGKGLNEPEKIETNSLICPECQSENKLESKFCIKCGSKLETSNESIEDVSDTENEEEVQLNIKNGTSQDNEIDDSQEVQLDVEDTTPLDEEIEDNAEISSDIEDMPESDTKTSILDEIKKAKELLDMGAVSEEEFEKIKNKYLEQLN